MVANTLESCLEERNLAEYNQKAGTYLHDIIIKRHIAICNKSGFCLKDCAQNLSCLIEMNTPRQEVNSKYFNEKGNNLYIISL